MIRFSTLFLSGKSAGETGGIRTSTTNVIVFSPLVILFLCMLSLVHPVTRRIALWMLEENHPIENLTFAVALAGGIFGLRLAWQARKHGEKVLVSVFFGAFSIFLLLVAMEEIAWGQNFIHFETPAVWRAINCQNETTLHNIRGLNRHSEICRLLFGLGGLAGVWLSRFPRFRAIAAPPILLPWFVVIALHAAIDVCNDIFPIEERFDFYVQRTSELIELFITASASLYLWLRARILARAWQHPSPPA